MMLRQKLTQVYLYGFFHGRKISRNAGNCFYLSQSNGPDYNIHIWLWEKAKIVASIKSTASNSVNQVVYQTLFNPGDNSQVSIVGNGIFRLFRLVENTLKPSPPKLEQKNVLCHTWTLDERVVCGTGEGKVYIFETNGELKYEFLHATLVPNPTGTPLPTPQQIHAISSFSKGILVAGGGGLVTLYERGDLLSGKELFRKSRNYTLPDPLTITKLSISPSEEAFVCQSESNQLYHSQITSEPKLDQMSLTILGDSLHSNSITGLDSCIRKSLVATSSSDSIRIWNYFDDKSEITKLFSDLVLTISFHPSGLYILVGFQDSLKLMNVLDNDLSVLREFPLKSVKVTSFSTGGQYFAASSYNMVYIYSTWTFEVLGTLKGHTGLITSISWVSDDSRIVTVGNEGGIYDWDLKDMSNYQGIGIKRQYEYVERGCMYTSICLGVDKKTIYAVGSDNTLKEVVEGRLKRQLNSDITLTNVCISNSGKFLITGTQNGSIRVIKHPFGEEDFNSFQEYFVHAGPITQLQISFDDQFLFSTGHDGCLFIFRIDSGSSKNFIYADEILVTRADLEEKNMIFNDLKTRAEELKMENDYQLRLKDLNFNEKIKQVTEKFVQEVDALKINATVLRDDKDKEESRHDEEMGETRKQHAKDLLDLENSQNTKITVEYQKIEALERLTAAQQSEWELSTKEMQTYREKTLKELNLHYDQQLKEKQSEMDMLREEIKRQSEEYEEIYKETEEDADRELVDLRNRFEKRYREEKEIVAKLKTDNAVMRKKYNALQAEIDSHKGEITKLNGEEKKMLLVIKTLEKDIAGLKNEVGCTIYPRFTKETRPFKTKKSEFSI